MAIDPTGQAATPGAFDFPTTNDIDQGTLVQLLGMQQTELLQKSLVSSLPNVSKQAELYGRVSAAGAKLSAVNSVVKDKELNSIDSASASLNQVPVHSRDSVEVTQADNERFQQLDHWAEERDIELKEMTKVIPPPSKDEIDAAAKKAGDDARAAAKNAGMTDEQADVAAEAASNAKRAEMEAIQPKTVVDVDAVAANKQKLAAYRGQVEAGTADNQVLRESIAAGVAELGLDGELKDLCVKATLHTMQDLTTESQSMLNWAVSIVKDLSDALSRAKAQVAELNEVFREFDNAGDFANLIDSDRENAKELATAIEKAAEKLEALKRGDAAQTADTLRDAMADLSDGANQAARIAQNLEDHSEHTNQVLEGLGEQEQEWVADQLRSLKSRVLS